MNMDLHFIFSQFLFIELKCCISFLGVVVLLVLCALRRPMHIFLQGWVAAQ
jgi:hypothetical protein